MNLEEKEMVQRWIEEAVAPLRMAIEALSTELEQAVERIEELEREVNRCASQEHYHDKYASSDHVERSENALNSRLYRIEEEARDLEYRISNVDRKAERAQSAAEDARRNSGGSRW